MTDPHAQKILILDFGAQYTQLIARRVREAGVYCELFSYDASIEDIRKFAPRGIILSGGPESVTLTETPRAPKEIFDMKIPILGICYGQQTMTAQLGGVVEAGDKREFGYARVRMHWHSKLFRDPVAATHRRPDRVALPPSGPVQAASKDFWSIDMTTQRWLGW